jgi:hypothetical protein
MKRQADRNGFFYITGCDGIGKTTQARLLVDYLRRQGQRVRHVWLRFPFFLSAPFLVYARLRKLSWQEQHEGKRYGYWDFSRSWLMKRIFPWILLVDAILAASWNVYIPRLFGWYVVCERFVLDMLADLSIGSHEPGFTSGALGNMFFHLIPPVSRVIVLDLDKETILSRRPDLAYDHTLDEKLIFYRSIAEIRNIPLIKTNAPVETVNEQIKGLIKN